MNRYEYLPALLQLLILLPAAASCFLSAKKQMKYTPAKTAALCLAVLLPCCLAAAAIHTLLHLSVNLLLLPLLVFLFFLYRRAMDLDLPRALAIYFGVCAIETFPVQLSYAFDAALHPASGANSLSVEAALLRLVLSCLLLAAFAYPATQKFTWAVENLDFPKIWYSAVTLSAIFFTFNALSVPLSYKTLHTGRMLWLFPIVEAVALAVLTAIYLLFYQSATVILDYAKLKTRTHLLEMQSRQYTALQEYLLQTANLRHDFRHSIRLLASLAETGDLTSIKAHIAEYEVRLAGNTITCYCKNAALNALFSYYQEQADLTGIDTDWNLELPEPLFFSELDLAALFGNLIENAIAGCRTVPEDARYFSLTTEVRHRNSLYVVSTNSFDGNVKRGKDGYRSTKHSGTGIGLASITAVAEKYGGSARASNSDREFFVDVILKMGI